MDLCIGFSPLMPAAFALTATPFFQMSLMEIGAGNALDLEAKDQHKHRTMTVSRSSYVSADPKIE